MGGIMSVIGFSPDDIRDVIFRTDAEGRWIYLSAAWNELLGFSCEESLGKLFFEFVLPEDRALNQQRFEPLIQRKKDHCLHEIRYLTKNGGYRWIEVHARLTFEEDGAISGTAGTLRDVTVRREGEEQLREALEANRKLVANLSSELHKVESLHGRLHEAQLQLDKFMESPQDLLKRIPAWWSTMAEDLKKTLGAESIAVYQILEGELKAIDGKETGEAPALPHVMEACAGDGRLGEQLLFPVRGMTGELKGALIISNAMNIREEGTEFQLLREFAKHLGNALEMAEVREKLASAEAQRAVTFRELHDKGIETLKVCPSCGRCFPHQEDLCPADGHALEIPAVLPFNLLDRYRFTMRLGQGAIGLSPN